MGGGAGVIRLSASKGRRNTPAYLYLEGDEQRAHLGVFQGLRDILQPRAHAGPGTTKGARNTGDSIAGSVGCAKPQSRQNGSSKPAAKWERQEKKKIKRGKHREGTMGTGIRRGDQTYTSLGKATNVLPETERSKRQRQDQRQKTRVQGPGWWERHLGGGGLHIKRFLTNDRGTQGPDGGH